MNCGNVIRFTFCLESRNCSDFIENVRDSNEIQVNAKTDAQKRIGSVFAIMPQLDAY